MDARPRTRLPSWGERAGNALARFSSTGSKRPDALYGGSEPYGPTHFVRAHGCTLETPEGRALIDCSMALGAVALGYGDEDVTRAVAAAAANGNVAGLNHTLEVEIAEHLCTVVPCAERVQFLKTGAEAVMAAIRLARTYSGKSEVIASGYFGWLDWCSGGEAGVPEAAAADVTRVPFDDLPALEAAAAQVGDQLAAIVIEPVVEHLPSAGWLRRAREICDAIGAVLIFDEIKTGFRLATGGYQMICDVNPDLATFGKAMANGYPVSVVCGQKDVMNAAHHTWVSSTLAGEATALAAVRAVLERHESVDVCGSLAETGKEMRAVLEHAISDSGVEGVEVRGIDQMLFLEFDESIIEAKFLRAAVQQGVLFKRGAYNFPSLAHDTNALDRIRNAAALAFNSLKQDPT